MSHGGSSGGDDTVEINMIPMIDIVIQLITFFLMLINFDNSNTDERVRLPIADLAKPSDTDIDEPLVLNVDELGQVSLLGEKFDADSLLFRKHMQREAAVALENMKANGKEVDSTGSPPKLWTTILIRADKEVEYGRIQRMVKTCQDLGFYKFALRANPGKESM